MLNNVIWSGDSGIKTVLSKYKQHVFKFRHICLGFDAAAAPDNQTFSLWLMASSLSRYVSPNLVKNTPRRFRQYPSLSYFVYKVFWDFWEYPLPAVQIPTIPKYSTYFLVSSLHPGSRIIQVIIFCHVLGFEPRTPGPSNLCLDHNATEVFILQKNVSVESCWFFLFATNQSFTVFLRGLLGML